MKKDFRNALKIAYEPPVPIHKEEFLRQLPVQKITLGKFFLQQLLYIRKRIWVVSALFFVLFLKLGHTGAVSWQIIPTLLPFLSLAGITELSRSSFCKMAELEMSCRFQLSQVLFARMLWLGLCTLPVLAAGLFAAGSLSAFEVGQVLLYVLTPYLLTCAGSLFLFNHMGSTEGVYGSAALACLMSMGNAMLQEERFFYREESLLFWYLTAFFALLAACWQLFQFIRKTEELPWNLFFIK